MENINPIVTGFIGILATVALFLIFPDIRLARVKREHAESEKVAAETDSIQLSGISEFITATTQTITNLSTMAQVRAVEYADALKKVGDSSIEMLNFVREKEIQISEERHLLISRIEELSVKVRQLDDEKSQLEDDLAAAKIKIDKLETDSTTQKKELRQLEKDYKVLKAEYDALKLERDNLLLQMKTSHVPLLEADSLATHILSKDGKDEIPSTSNLGSVAGDSANS